MSDELLEETQEEILDESPSAEDAEDASDDEIVEESSEMDITLDGEEEPEEEEKAPSWVSDVRKQNRELKRKFKEAEKRLNELQSPGEVSGDPGAMPDISNFDYDNAKYSAAVQEWVSKKQKFEQQNFQAEQQSQQEQQRITNLQSDHSTRAASLGLSDYKEVEAEVAGILPVEFQVALLESPKSEQLAYYLGKNADKLEEMAKLSPMKFAMELGRLESRLKLAPKARKAPPPVDKVKSSQAASGIEGRLEKARAKAAKTGDYREVSKLKRELKKG